MSESSRRPARPAPAAEPPPVVGLADLAEARALYAELDPAWFDRRNDPDAWLFEPEVQALIEEMVEGQVAAFAPLLPPDDLRVLREELVLACHTDPVSIEYLKRIRPRAPQDSSGKIRTGMFDAPPAAAPPGKKAGGERP